MKNILIVLGLCVWLISCDNNRMLKIERKGEPNIYSTPGDDQKMNEAIATARSTLEQFKGALENNKEFVNADGIAAGLSPFNPESVAIEAGKIMLTRINELLKAGVDFAFETT